MAYTMIAERNNQKVRKQRESALMVLANAQVMQSEGWQVVIVDNDGSDFEPRAFEASLAERFSWYQVKPQPVVAPALPPNRRKTSSRPKHSLLPSSRPRTSKPESLRAPSSTSATSTKPISTSRIPTAPAAKRPSWPRPKRTRWNSRASRLSSWGRRRFYPVTSLSWPG